MRKDQIYLVDCDEVLADCVNPMLDELSQLVGKRYDKDDMPDWDILGSFGHSDLWPEMKKRVARPGFCSSFPILSGAQEGMKLLEKLPGTIVILTSPMNSPFWAVERTEWIKKNFGIPAERVIQTSGKEYVAGTCLVDDKQANVLKWKKRHPRGAAILWDAPYNKEFDSPIISKQSSWEELYEELRHL